MRILYYSDVNSVHTIKWCRYFADKGHDVHVASFTKIIPHTETQMQDITVHWLQNRSVVRGSEIQKLGYLCTIQQAKRLVNEVAPDVIHAHYASSYGFVASLAVKRPYYLSVWGSDVYDFPKKSFVHRAAIKRALAKPKWLMSTSSVMAKECQRYTNRHFEITPFGVDMKLFSPEKRIDHEGFVIGTVKMLEKKYGIDCMLRACALLHDKRPDLNLRVRIAGTGSMAQQLRELASSLKMDEYLTWLGFIAQEEVVREWASFDIGVIVSESESFGVAAVEAQSCGTPLIISDAPGLVEACAHGKTAIVVPRRNPTDLAFALEKLADDPDLRQKMSLSGINNVKKSYEIDKCFEKVLKIYEENLQRDTENY